MISIFSKDNAIGSLPKQPTGLIQVFGGNLVVQDTTFLFNDNAAENDEIHYMIGNFGGDLVLTHNCFIQNNVTLAPVVNQGGNISSDSNAGAYTNLFQKVACHFIAYVTRGTVEDTPINDLFFECLDYESDSCSLAEIPIIPTPAPTARECWESLLDIYYSEKRVEDSSILRTYVLCPDTVYDIGSEYDDYNIALDGDQFLLISRPNMQVLCGENGDSANKCTFMGGSFQVGLMDEFDSGEDISNILVKGVTFQGASIVNVLANGYGDVTLEDCIFQVS